LRKIFSTSLILLFLAACSQVFALEKTPVLPTRTISFEAIPTAAEANGLTETPASLNAAETVTPSAEAAPGGGNLLTVWIPPQFDPNAGTPAGELLKARLQAFEDEHPGTQIEVRVKAPDGPGGLLDSLVAASAAAPGALPDLVALPRPLLEIAALRGLVYSFDGLTNVLDQEDWYGYARDLAHLQQSTFGLPFAGDALVLVDQPQEETEPPRTWNSVLEYPGAFAFAASDPEALFTLAQYQSAGGKIQDEQGRPALDAEILSEVLNLYTNALQAGRVSDRLSQLSTHEQAWDAFREGQYTMAATWASLPLTAKDRDVLLIPTPEGISYTLATGWAWAIASPKSQQRELSAALAEYLVEPAFLAHWSEISGFLPPRANAVELWQDESARSLADDVSLSAHLIPSGDIISSLGSTLQQAVLQVLRQEKTPIDAAQEAVNSLGIP
jgi:multiple sugar transport system substrate-binding protein